VEQYEKAEERWKKLLHDLVRRWMGRGAGSRQ